MRKIKKKKKTQKKRGLQGVPPETAQKTDLEEMLTRNRSAIEVKKKKNQKNKKKKKEKKTKPWTLKDALRPSGVSLVLVLRDLPASVQFSHDQIKTVILYQRVVHDNPCKDEVACHSRRSRFHCRKVKTEVGAEVFSCSNPHACAQTAVRTVMLVR